MLKAGPQANTAPAFDNGESLDTVIIGGGPGGIVALKEVVAAGVTRVALLERSARIGGLFAAGFDGLRLTSSAPFSMFSDFPIPVGHDNHYWTKDEAVGYWSDYIAHFGIGDLIRFGHEVGAICRLPDGGWQISLAGGPALRARTVIVATGNNVTPNLPDWNKDIVDVPVIHSSGYRNAEPFAGKTVVIVGGGESAADITLEIAGVARKCTISLRGGPGWVVPRYRGKVAADLSTHRAFWKLPASTGAVTSAMLLRAERRRAKSDSVMAQVVRLNEAVISRLGVRGTFGTKSLGLAQAIAWHGACVTGGIERVEQGGRVLVTSTGERITDVDMVLLATGYRAGVPVLPDALRSTDLRKLYKHMIDPETGGTLIRIGFAHPPFGSQFPIMEMQARLAARIITGQHRLPAPQAMREAALRDEARLLAQFGKSGHRVRGLVDYGNYLDDLAALIGCKPRFWRLLLTRPRLWLRVQYGAMQSSQFRLHGPGAQPALARDILKSLPLCPSGHVLRAGLVGLAYDLLTAGPFRRRLGRPARTS